MKAVESFEYMLEVIVELLIALGCDFDKEVSYDGLKIPMIRYNILVGLVSSRVHDSSLSARTSSVETMNNGELLEFC